MRYPTSPPLQPDADSPWLRWIDHHRPWRVGELLAIIWLLSLADLFFTVWAHTFTAFDELNPLARLLLQSGAVGLLIAFKLGVTLTSSCAFWHVRSHRRAELALWAMVAVYLLLTWRWSAYTLHAVANI